MYADRVFIHTSSFLGSVVININVDGKGMQQF